MSEYSQINFEIKENIAHLVLNRPERLNALGKTTLNELNAAMDRAEADDAVRVIIISGAGRSFSSGFDLKEQMEGRPAGAKIWQKIAPAAKGLVPVESLPQALGLGLIWGWLPCGLVYSVLLLAATTTDPFAGACVMLAFGLGTMPAMIATGMSASKLAQFMSGKRLGAGLLIVLLGIATIAMPVMKLTGSQGEMDHSQHSMGQ